MVVSHRTRRRHGPGIALASLLMSIFLCGPAGAAPPAAPAANAPSASARPRFVVPPIDKPHPRLVMDAQEVQRMRERAKSKAEPFHTAWLTLKADADKALAPSAAPKPYTGRHSKQFYDALQRDALHAEELAYAYAVTQDERYARRAAEIIAAWATATPTPGADFDPEIHFTGTGMFVARSLYPMLFAYDLLYHSPALTAEGKQAAEKWFRALAEPIRRGADRWDSHGYFHHQYYQNHLVTHTVGQAIIGWTVGDREMVQYAIDSDENNRDVVELIEGMILMPGDEQVAETFWGPPAQKGEIIDRYRHGKMRGLQYAHLSMTQLVLIAEIARHHGIDLYGYTAPGGENLELPLAFYADFFRTKDSSIKGGFYSGEDATLKDGWMTGIYEVAAQQYPNNPDILRLLTSVNRAEVPRHEHTYFAQPVLSHGLKPHELSGGPQGAPTQSVD